MEFKGTKGKWSLGDKRKSYQFIDCKDQAWYEIARVVVKLDGELSIEGKANALLISKSPILLQAIYDSIEPLKKAGLKEMADYHEKIYLESVNL